MYKFCPSLTARYWLPIALKQAKVRLFIFPWSCQPRIWEYFVGCSHKRTSYACNCTALWLWQIQVWIVWYPFIVVFKSFLFAFKLKPNEATEEHINALPDVCKASLPTSFATQMPLNLAKSSFGSVVKGSAAVNTNIMPTLGGEKAKPTPTVYALLGTVRKF